MFRLLFLSCLLGLTAELSAKATSPRTVPMPPKQKYDTIARMNMANEVPTPLENYKYTLIGEVDGLVFYPSAVPLFRDNGSKSAAKTLPIGTEVNPTYVKSRMGRHFYGIPENEVPEGKAAPTKILWIDGRFIKISKK